MADVLLTCAETPLAWPASVDIGSLTVTKTSRLHVFSPTAGSLQIHTRRPWTERTKAQRVRHDGVGDGVTIDESPNVGADYRGQRYSLEQVVFHTPGLHIFPGQSDVYPAELHVHMQTFTAPQRALTIVIPVSHKIPPGPGQDYFAAMSKKPSADVARPLLTSILPASAKLLIYRAPDVRGRTADVPVNDITCAPDAMHRDFVLVLDVASIRATDLERIPREGSRSTDPRHLPAPGVQASQTIPRDRILRCVTLADPGLVSTIADAPLPTEPARMEMECKPIKVVNGRDVVDVSGRPVDIAKLLGFDISGGPSSGESAGFSGSNAGFAQAALMFIGTAIGLLFADWVTSKIWGICFNESNGRLFTWEPLKLIFFLSICMTAAGFSDTPISYALSVFQS